MKWYLVTPALKVSGGNRETIRLGAEMAACGAEVSLLSMWSDSHPMSSPLYVDHLSDWRPRVRSAAMQMPFLLRKFSRWLKCHGARETGRFIFTHYTTLPLATLVPPAQRYFHVQDLEWRFIANRYGSELLRRMILYYYHRGELISANTYLTAALRSLGLPVAFEAPVWADERFAAAAAGIRDIDFAMVLRKGGHKRLDLYLAFIELAKRHLNVKLAVVSPDEDIAAMVRSSVAVCLVRPSLNAMRDLYTQSKCFLHLSDHEGFGLPPLEAMAAGCVPLCRDSGGVRAFMDVGALRALLLPRSSSIEEIFARGQALLADDYTLCELAHAAQQIFHEGAARSAEARRAQVRLLVA